MKPTKVQKVLYLAIKKYIKNQTTLSWNTKEIVQKAKSKYLIEYQSEILITVEAIAKT